MTKNQGALMSDIYDLAIARKNLKIALWCTTPAAILMLGISFLNDSPRPTPSMGGGGGGGGGAWSQVESTVTPQSSISGGIGSIFKRSGRYETRRSESGQAEELSVSDAASPPPVPAAPPPPLITMNDIPAQARPNAAEMSAGDVAVRTQPVSTFAVDVDTASYSRMRQVVLQGRRPNPGDVRVEEMVNYFRYDLQAPRAGEPFSITTDVVTTPWNPQTRLMRVALNGAVVPQAERPPANIVLLVDVSGSMEADNKLGLVKRSFSDMVGNLGPRDKVSIVTYGSTAAVLLPSTSDRRRIRDALGSLQAAGGTAGAEGLNLAYQQARLSKIPGGINRVMVASDGDFNVGMSDTASLKAEIARQRRDGITLTTLGVGGSSGNFNDGLMESLADVGNGNAAYLDDDLEARKVLRQELESNIHMIAKDVKAQVEFNPAAVQSYRLIGYQNRRLAEQDFDNDEVDAGEIGSGHQVTAIYEITPVNTVQIGDVASRRRFEANRVRSELSGGIPQTPLAANGEAVFVKLRYKTPKGETSRLLQRSIPNSAIMNAGAPIGDTAFAISVAAFGSTLADNQPRTFDAQQIVALAGTQTNPQRVEFIDMVRQYGAAAMAPTPSYQPPMITPRSVSVPSPTYERVYVESNPARSIGGWLAVLSGILALCMLWVDRKIANLIPVGRILPTPESRRNGATRQGDDAPSREELEDARNGGGRILDMTELHAALSMARKESSSETEGHLAAFEFAAHRAIKAATHDAFIADEVEAVLQRHAPAYLQQYTVARRRATANQIERLETSLKQTIDTLTERLRDLLESQSERDADHVDENEAFIRQRHGGRSEALA